MAQRTPSQIGFVKLSNSDFVLARPEQDICGYEVYDADGRRVGNVEDLYVDGYEREVRFLQVGAGGFLGMGEKHYLVPVEAVVEVGEGRLTIEPGRTERVVGPAPFDAEVKPSYADDRSDDYTSFTFGRRPY